MTRIITRARPQTFVHVCTQMFVCLCFAKLVLHVGVVDPIIRLDPQLIRVDVIIRVELTI